MDNAPGAPIGIDLNGDLGEGFGPYEIGSDEDLLGCVSSASIACGFHAGDPATMRRTVRRALERGVAVGAHPGLPDRLGFGRREMVVSPDEAYEMVLYQIGALEAFVRAEGGRLAHVKPHGALYTMAARDPALARAIAEAVRDYDARLVLYGLSGGELVRAGEATGLRTASEVFADRRYASDGRLADRRLPGAVIEDPEEALGQALRLAMEGRVRTLDGNEMQIRGETMCVHGDTPHAVQLARTIRERLVREGVQVRPVPE